MTTHPNFIAGEPARGDHDGRGREPVRPIGRDRLVRDGRCGTGRRRRRGRALGAAGTGRRPHPPIGSRRSRSVGVELTARATELGELLSREEGKPRAEGIARGPAGRVDLQVLRRRGAADGRRACALGPPRRRRRRDPRAARRGRRHHAVELPDRDPGLEDRAGARLRQRRRVQAGAARARERLGARRDPVARRSAAGHVQLRERRRRDGRRAAGPPSGCPGRHVHRVAGRGATGRGGVRGTLREDAARDGREEPARRPGRRAISTSRSTVPCRARSSRRASAARRARG